MRIATTLPHFMHFTDPGVIVSLAQDLEEAGVHSLWVSDHIVVPEGSSFIPESFTEPLATLSFLAGNTTRVQLGTSVLIAPYRHPVFSAKFLSSVDVLSRGRVIAGVGVGWMPEEFDALGVPLAERGARTDECLDVWRNLWTTEVSSFEGRFTRYERMRFDPKASPERSGTIPVWVGGPSEAAIHRAATRGDGWHPQNLSPAQLEDGVRRYRAHCEEAGRTPGTVCMRHLPGGRFPPDGGYRFGGDAEACVSDLMEYAEAGLDMLMLSLHPKEPAELVDKVAWFIDVIAPRIGD